MTTFAPPAVESDIRDEPVQPVPQSDGQQAGLIGSQINGSATQHNSAIAEFTSPAKPPFDATSQGLHSTSSVPNQELNNISSMQSADVSAPASTMSSEAPNLDQSVSSIPLPESTELAVPIPSGELSNGATETATPSDNTRGPDSRALAAVDLSAQSVHEPSQPLTAVPESQMTPVLPPTIQPEAPKPEPIAEPLGPLEPKDEEMTDAPSKVTREREEDEEDGPSAKRVRTEENTPAKAEEQQPGSSAVPANATEAATEAGAQPTVDSAHEATATAPASTAPGTTAPNFAPPQPSPHTDSSPMSDLQQKKLLDGMRNLKKAKNALNFLKPVDHVALGLPNYPNVVKEPMDLGTIETKLKDGKYASVDSYTADWDLMVNNAVAFNGQAHIVAQQGMMLRSQLWAQLRKLPKAGEVPQPAPKKIQTSLAGAIRDTPRRNPAPATAATTETFAAPNGIPTIRRGSSVNGRPKREIHKPTRDLAYQSAKPLKKKHKAEIDFCKHVLEEMTRPRYEQLFGPFYKPVDPVALAIPHYFSIIKKPMSLSVVKDKLNTNQYETAKEVEADVKQIWENCYKFNGKTHAVSNMAMSYEKLFNEEFSKKNDWIAAHAPASAPQSPIDDSGSEEDDEDEEEDPEAAQIAIIQRQMQELQEKTMALLEAKAAKKAGGAKKGKGSGKAVTTKKRKSGSLGGPKAEKKATKPKNKERAVTVAEKQEISSKIGDLNAEQITKAAELIKASLRKIGRHDLADKAEDDMEFDIDQIPNDALHDLLKLVRKASAAPLEETSYSTSKSSAYAPSKPKKNKPMSKTEQEDHIQRLQSQLANFENGGAMGSPVRGDDSSEDEEDEESGSESEEE